MGLQGDGLLAPREAAPQPGTDPKPRPDTEVARPLPPPRDRGSSEGEQHSSERSGSTQGTLPRRTAPPKKDPKPGTFASAGPRQTGMDFSANPEGQELGADYSLFGERKEK